MNILVWSIVIFLAILTQVVFGTVRLIVMVKGQKILAMTIGFFEASISLTIAITVVTQAVKQGINIFMILSYAAGFALGLFIGMLISDRISKDMLSINVISKKHADMIENVLRNNGFGVTCYSGSGKDGNVKIMNVICQKNKFRDLQMLVQEIDPKVLVASHTLEGLSGGFPYGIKSRL